MEFSEQARRQGLEDVNAMAASVGHPPPFRSVQDEYEEATGERHSGLHELLRYAVLERARQITVKGHTAERDDQYEDGELQRAAAAYALASGRSVDLAVRCWPWKTSDGDQLVGFRPATWENRNRDLVKAVALLMAEWDRLQRAGQTP